MKYSEVVDSFETISSTTKRLEITDHLVSLFSKTPNGALPMVVYMLTGELRPKYEGVVLGLAEKLVIEALHDVTGLPEKTIKASYIKRGDIGRCAEEMLSQKEQTTLFSEPLTVERVYNTMMKIAKTSGSRSQDAKMRLISELLHDAIPVEGKYIAKTLIGKLRLGVADMTILDALAIRFGSKGDRVFVERAYNLTSDLGGIAKLLAEKGMEEVRAAKIEIGKPIRSMLAERVTSMDELFERAGAPCIVEYKYDGMRIQAHISPDDIRLFSRRADDITSAFPDVVGALKASFRGRSAVVEGECVPIDKKSGGILPFQVVSHRRGRKYGVDDALHDIPVGIFMFDCMHADGKDMIDEPLSKRREVISGLFEWGDRIRQTLSITASKPSDVDPFFKEATSHACEGVMGKSVNGIYKAGTRGFLWVKLKKDYLKEAADSFDLVVIGAYHGRGRRTGTYGGVLAATYNPEENGFETICKVGTGFDDETLRALPEILGPEMSKTASSRVNAKMKADVWFEPKVVLEVVASEITVSPVHTCGEGMTGRGGLALRFPRFTGRWRTDKSPEDATTSEEVYDMYVRSLESRRKAQPKGSDGPDG